MPLCWASIFPSTPSPPLPLSSSLSLLASSSFYPNVAFHHPSTSFPSRALRSQGLSVQASRNKIFYVSGLISLFLYCPAGRSLTPFHPPTVSLHTLSSCFLSFSPCSRSASLCRKTLPSPRFDAAHPHPPVVLHYIVNAPNRSLNKTPLPPSPRDGWGPCITPPPGSIVPPSSFLL